MNTRNRKQKNSEINSVKNSEKLKKKEINLSLEENVNK
jgi:hypothetical protein